MIQTKAGHKLIFDDTDGKESIEVQTKGDLDIVLDDEKKRIIIRDKGKKNSVTIDSDNGTITIQAEKKVNISAGSTKIILESGGNLSMTSDSKASLKSSKVTVNGDSTEIKASGTMTVSSGGQTSVKGSIVKIN